jgi:peptide chain release factor 1
VVIKMTRINLKDVEFQAFSGSGPGGQNRNKVQCCIRLRHIPTGIVVVATRERSQIKNKQAALAELEKRLADITKEKVADARKGRYNGKDEASFGSRDVVRTYRLTGNPQGVISNGKLYSIEVLTKGRLELVK